MGLYPVRKGSLLSCNGLFKSPFETSTVLGKIIGDA
jgi:hypothetical protein